MKKKTNHKFGDIRGKNYWIYKDKLPNANEYGWFLCFETNDLERKKWSGWVSQWDVAYTFNTEKEVVSYLKSNCALLI
tara:strand:- start:962 stop:1195 length:234 start_codon:yes stop_codon:yes gene_type:complete